MKRLRIDLIDIAERGNLLLALHQAARGKRHRPGVQCWLQDPDGRLGELSRQVLSGEAPQGQARRFLIHDPKRREIAAACFADRVLHHAIMNLAEPRLEAYLPDVAWACRVGRGLHPALAAVQRGLQRQAWVVQVDVQSYFSSICHHRLLALLQRLFKGGDFLDLLARILAAGSNEPGRGLPIGALTSQHWANAYLASADRVLLEFPGVWGPVRYMDDVVWFCPSREAARHSLEAYRSHVHGQLALQLKDRVILRPSDQGVQFCGFRIKPGGLWPGARKRRRWHQAARRLLAAERANVPHGLLQRAHDLALAGLVPTQSIRMRRACWWPQAGDLGSEPL